MRRLTLLHHLLFLFFLTAAGIAFAFRAGVVPVRFSPLPPLDLAVADAWFRDWRIAELAHDRDLCRKVMVPAYIAAEPIADLMFRDGCGLVNGLRMTRAGGARLSLDKVSCPLAASLALWMEHTVQAHAVARLGSRVASVTHFGGYSCRNIKGAPWLSEIRSEHATANAIDIAAFVLADGRAISVLKHWQANGPEAAFLKAVHAGACGYFRVVLGPEYNDLHKDHFHFDRGMISRCR